MKFQRDSKNQISADDGFSKITITLKKDKFTRGNDTHSKFQRGNAPPELCYVCHKGIKELDRLRELREDDYGSDGHVKMQGVVAEKVVRLFHNGVQIFRHADTCEPGSVKYMRNTKLAKSYAETFRN